MGSMGLEFLYRQPVTIRFGWGKIAELAAENLKRQYDGVIIAGAHDGYFSDEAEAVFKKEGLGAFTAREKALLQKT